MDKQNRPDTEYIHLISRGILLIKGEDAESFLQGLITQSVENLQKDELRYGAHLTPKGRIIADFFFFKTEEGILLDVNVSILMKLATALHGFKVSEHVEFHDLTEDYIILSDLTGTEGLQDPRLKKMGTRLYLKTDKSTAGYQEEKAYTKQRIHKCIPDFPFDGTESTLANEMLLEHLNGIDFEKGCYVGQEITARTKYRTQPKKKLFYVRSSQLIPSNRNIVNESDRIIGEVFTTLGQEGIALIKEQSIKDGSGLFVSTHPIEAFIPKWARKEKSS
ncbi:MAG: hypothetical protein OSB62_03125 [Alphaproteobacteria bacterium]|nr:hypothetical protein [Alphaproteobacteria bacterium]